MKPARLALEPARWAQLSPRLDELLSLEPPARVLRLAAWRTESPELAEQLQDLLAAYPSIQADDFLEDDPRAAAGWSGPGPAGAPEALAGTACGAWTLERPLGSGGMGSVWLARRTDGRYQAAAAIKLPHRAVLAQGGAARFEREGRLLARVSHPHIAALLDAGVTAAGQPYLVLEYVQGEAIDSHCDRLALGVDARIALFLDVLGAVAHAHAQLVLHRDLKPSNILVDAASAQVKLLDFGIARLIEGEGEGAGASDARTQRAFTPEHAAPEQLQGQPVGTATDVYALGVLLYRLLVLHHPTARPGQTPVEQLRAVVDTEPPPLSQVALQLDADTCARRATRAQHLARTLRGDLDTIVAKALKKDPAQRYASAVALADDLRRWRARLPVQARPDRAGYRLRLFVRRHRLGLGVAASALGVLVVAAAVAGWQAVQATRERDEARWQAERAQARSELLNLMLGQLGALDAPLTQRQILDRAVQLVHGRYGERPRVAVELLLPIAGQYQSQGDAQADLAVMEAATRYARHSGLPDLIAETACSTVDTYIALNRLDDAEAALGTAAQALSTMGDPPVQILAACWRYEAQLAREKGEYQRSLDAALRSRRQLEAAGRTGGNIYRSLLDLLAVLYRDNGDPGAAFATRDQLAQIHQRQGMASTLAALHVERGRAVLLADAGELAEAAALLRQLVARAGGPDGDAAPTLLPTQVQLELALDRIDEAEAVLEQAARRSGLRADPSLDTKLAYLRAEVALKTGRSADARRWLDAALGSPGRGVLRYATPTPGTLRARLLLAQGQVPAALQQVDAELAALERDRVGNLEQRAQAWRTAAEVLLAAQQPQRALGQATLALEASTRAARDPAASAWVGEAHALLARAQAALGDRAAARMHTLKAADALARGLGADHARTLQARAQAEQL